MVRLIVCFVVIQLLPTSTAFFMANSHLGISSTKKVRFGPQNAPECTILHPLSNKFQGTNLWYGQCIIKLGSATTSKEGFGIGFESCKHLILLYTDNATIDVTL